MSGIGIGVDTGFAAEGGGIALARCLTGTAGADFSGFAGVVALSAVNEIRLVVDASNDVFPIGMP